MLKGITRPAIYYDLVGLANNGVINIGRESDSTVRMDCPEVPFLLSRKHAIVRVQPNGSIVIRDLNSTNGTYIGGEGEFLHRMRADEVWELKKGDIVGFGGPETIVARSEQPDIIVANPFLFKYSPLDDLDSIPPPQPEYVQPGYYGVLAEPRRLDFALQEIGRAQPPAQEPGHDMEGVEVVEEPLVSPPEGKENKLGKRKKSGKDDISGRDIATMLSNHLMCSICHEWLAAAHAVSCGHMFCGGCLNQWIVQANKQTCPECRKPIAGIPVRCRNVDNTISDLLGTNLMSPNAKRERRRKTNAWEQVGDSVAEEWANVFLARRQKATADAARQLAVFTGVPVPAAPPAPPAPHPAPALAPAAAPAAPAAAPAQGVAAGGRRRSGR